MGCCSDVARTEDADADAGKGGARQGGGGGGPSKPSSLVRLLPVFQYLLELASGVWVLECGVLTSPGA